MTKIDIDASELDRASESLLKLAKNLGKDADTFKEESGDKMQNKIVRSVLKNFKNHNTDPESESLHNAFKVMRKTSGSTITTAQSDVDYARALEEGIEPHVIEGDPWLAFKPDDISKYPKPLRTEDDYVVTQSVVWKPRKPKTATGYEYVLEAQRKWDLDMRVLIEKRITNSILISGYKRSR